MRTLPTILMLIAMIPIIAISQIHPEGNRFPIERQPVRVSMPEKVNFFTQQPPFMGTSDRFEFDSLNVSYLGSWALGQSFSISCNGP